MGVLFALMEQTFSVACKLHQLNATVLFWFYLAERLKLRVVEYSFLNLLL